MTESARFAEPWEARTFALVRTLRDGNVFSAAEWSDALTEQIGSDTVHAVDYVHWLGAVERLLAEKRLAGEETLQRHRAAWRHAAERTPHGQPITLIANDFPN